MSLKPKRPVEIVHQGGHLFYPLKRKFRTRLTRAQKNLADQRESEDAAESVKMELEKGWKTEQRFERFVQGLIRLGKNPWIRDIRKASKAEDHLGHYDFVITFWSQYGHEHAYQVAVDTKSSWYGVTSYREEFGENGIFPIVASADLITDGKLREVLRQIWFETRIKHPHFDDHFKK